MINNTFKYYFSYIKIKIKNERNDIIILKKKGKEEDRKHTRETKWVNIYNPVEFI